jgi:hypothetical protein
MISPSVKTVEFVSNIVKAIKVRSVHEITFSNSIATISRPGRFLKPARS